MRQKNKKQNSSTNNTRTRWCARTVKGMKSVHNVAATEWHSGCFSWIGPFSSEWNKKKCFFFAGYVSVSEERWLFDYGIGSRFWKTSWLPESAAESDLCMEDRIKDLMNSCNCHCTSHEHVTNKVLESLKSTLWYSRLVQKNRLLMLKFEDSHCKKKRVQNRNQICAKIV